VKCKRCGEPITGKGKTGMCVSCAGSLSMTHYLQIKRRGKTIAWVQALSAHRRRNIPITLAGGKK
jgi:hypothetical protein